MQAVQVYWVSYTPLGCTITEIVVLIQDRATTSTKDVNDGGESVSAIKLADETMTALDELRKLTESTAKEFVNTDYLKPVDALVVRQ